MEELQPARKTSVLIVSYNCAAALERCVRALEASENREEIEILVVDAGSVDGSEQVDSEFPEVTVLRLPRNFGRTKARNIGVRTAKGDFLLLLDPDVEVRPDTVASLVSLLEQEPDVVAAGPRLLNPAGEEITRAGRIPDLDELRRAWSAGATLRDLLPVQATEPAGAGPAPVEFPDPKAVLVRKQFVRGMNYFDERYGEFGSDLELYTQACRASRKVVLAPGAVAICREGEGMWRPADEAERSALEADFASGIAAYAAKHYGWFAGFKLQLRMILATLLALRLGMVSRLLGGFKIDGSQGEV